MEFKTIRIAHTGDGYCVTIDDEPHHCANMAELTEFLERIDA